MGGRGAMTARHVNQEKPKSSFHFYFFFSAQRCIFEKQGQTRVERINGGTQWPVFFFISVIVNSERDSVQFPSFTLRFGVTSGMIFTNVSTHSSST